MGLLERIILLIYFPQFSSPKSSRFESFFLSALKKDNPFKKKPNKSKIIFPEKIIRNEDKRTSLIIKGIPNNMPKKEVRDFIEKYGNINYLFIINDKNDKDKNTSIAFVNFINYKSVITVFMNLRNLKIVNKGQIYTFHVMYSNAQGKEELKEFINQKKYL